MMRWTKVVPASERVPWVMRRHITPERRPCSAVLFVGSTPSTSRNRNTSVPLAQQVAAGGAPAPVVLLVGAPSAEQLELAAALVGAPLEAGPCDVAVLERAPHGGHFFGEGQQDSGDGGAVAARIDHGLEIALQVRPTQLATREPFVGAPAVAVDDTGKPAGG